MKTEEDEKEAVGSFKVIFIITKKWSHFNFIKMVTSKVMNLIVKLFRYARTTMYVHERI